MTSAVVARMTKTPKTILGFFLAVLGVIVVGFGGAAVALANSKHSSDLVPWVLAGGAVAFFVLIFFVAYLTLKDPAKLQLGHVTATEYMAMHRASLGDSDAGLTAQVVVPANVPGEASEAITGRTVDGAEEKERGSEAEGEEEEEE